MLPLAGVLLAVVTTIGVGDPVEIEAQLRRAKNEYAYGNYDRAVEQLRGVMYPMQLTNDEQVIEARKYLALSYFLTGKLEASSEEFAKLLYLSPDYQLDPYTIAPPIIEFFEIIRRKLKPELDAIRQRKSDEKLQLPARQGYIRTVEQTFIERSDFATLMPFGAGQFQNGDTGLGVFFLLSEVGLLAVNVGAFLWAMSLGDYETQDRRMPENLTIAQYAAAGLFGIMWSVGVVQARLNFQPIAVGPRSVREEPMTPRASLGGSLQLRLDF